MKIEIPLRLGSGENNREHFMDRKRRVSAEKAALGWHLNVWKDAKPEPICTFIITRISPSKHGLDDDNLAGACKALRDRLAEWIGVDDKLRDVVRYTYANEQGPWGVRIECKKGIV